MAMRAFKRVEPSNCRECGAPITTITRGQTSELEPPQPARWGCGHLASGYKYFGPGPDRIEVTYTGPAFPTFGELGWRDPDPATTEKQIEAASTAIGRKENRSMIGWNEHGHAHKTGLPIDVVLGLGDLQDAENCGYNPIGILATMRVKPQTYHGDPVDQFRAGRIELLDGTVLERGGTLGAVWAVTQLPEADRG